MADLLSQEEVNALLEAVATSGETLDSKGKGGGVESASYKKKDPQYG